MRGKVTDQDLTNYALNELPPNERFYVESMLAVSEECRHDVYQSLDISEMLKEGFEQEESGAELLLNDEQRFRVLTVPRWHWRGFLQRAAAVALLAAGTAFALNQHGLWHANDTNDNLANAQNALGGLVEGVKNKGVVKTAEEYIAARMQAAKPVDSSDFQFVAAPAVCTPPIFEMPSMPDIAEM